MTHLVSKTKHYTVLRMPIYRTKIILIDVEKPLKYIGRLAELKSVDDSAKGILAECQYYTRRGSDAQGIVMRLPATYCESTLWHESMHACAMTFELAGVDYTNDYGEILCYTVEWLVKMVKQEFYNMAVDFNE